MQKAQTKKGEAFFVFTFEKGSKDSSFQWLENAIPQGIGDQLKNLNSALLNNPVCSKDQTITQPRHRKTRRSNRAKKLILGSVQASDDQLSSLTCCYRNGTTLKRQAQAH